MVDLFAATSFSNDFDNMHRTIDNLNFSTRMEAIREFVPKEKQTEYYFPLYLYHDRWSELEIKDFLPYFLRYAPKRNGRKGATLVSDWNSCEVPLDAVKCAEDGIATEGLPETNVIWYNRLKRLCDDSGTELLFVVVPYQMPVGGSEENTVKQMKMFNATEDWCRDNGVGYLNLFRNLEDMGIDFSTDMQDVSHVNLLGAQKVTETVGEYISKNYDISHNRDNTTEAVWNGYLETYLAEENAAMDVLEKNIGK